MKDTGIKNPKVDLSKLGIKGYAKAHWNLSPAKLIEETVCAGMGTLADNGALVVETGEFTGRAPHDRFIVEDEVTHNTVDWGEVNKKFEQEKFDQLYEKITEHFKDKDLYVRDAYACADKDYRLDIRVVNELPWQNLFVHNLFLRPTKEEIKNAKPEWTILSAPTFSADADEDGTRQGNFVVINFSKKMVIIGGTGYAGEIKKSIFSVLNFILPYKENVLSMHCSANVGEQDDTAIFFGLSGTGKTTLSADPNRKLIGDDEHGWSDDSVFNFEGGCYAKTIDLTEEKEPQIYRAIKFGTVVENVGFEEGRSIDYTDDTKTQNTRAGYPIYHINNAMQPSIGPTPDNIFFLTCDAFGVLPPISKLDPGQAMYHFISGYTAKVAGTEAGITEPKITFSACFGAPFLPLHPTKYAEMLGEKMREQNVNVWLVNTGWTGGPYGEGHRMNLPYTRAMITAALEGKLDDVAYDKHGIFGLAMPKTCPDVPSEVLNPRNTWENPDKYDQKAQELAKAFIKNFEKYADKATDEIRAAEPKVSIKV